MKGSAWTRAMISHAMHSQAMARMTDSDRTLSNAFGHFSSRIETISPKSFVVTL